MRIFIWLKLSCFILVISVTLAVLFSCCISGRQTHLHISMGRTQDGNHSAAPCLGQLTCRRTLDVSHSVQDDGPKPLIYSLISHKFTSRMSCVNEFEVRWLKNRGNRIRKWDRLQSIWSTDFIRGAERQTFHKNNSQNTIFQPRMKSLCTLTIIWDNIMHFNEYNAI